MFPAQKCVHLLVFFNKNTQLFKMKFRKISFYLFQTFFRWSLDGINHFSRRKSKDFNIVFRITQLFNIFKLSIMHFDWFFESFDEVWNVRISIISFLILIMEINELLELFSILHKLIEVSLNCMIDVLSVS